MGVGLQGRRVITNEVASRYQKASKKGKGKILDEFVALTACNRTYASHLGSEEATARVVGSGQSS